MKSPCEVTNLKVEMATRRKASIANADLWQQLDEEASKREVTWEWVRAHDGCPLNEHADRLANKEAERVQELV